MRSPFEYWRSGNGLPHITPPGKEWPEGDGFREKIRDLFFLQQTVEFGCGRGRLAGCFDPALYMGFDICEKAIMEATAAKPEYSFFVDDGFSSLMFGDALLSHTVLLHVPDDLLSSTIARFQQPRVIVSEILGREWRNRSDNPPVFNRGLMEYEAAFKAQGYKLHRVLFHPYPHYEGTDLSILEFHRDH